MILNQNGESSKLDNRFVNGSHIIYVYSCQDYYLVSAINYVMEGIKYNQGLLFVDSTENIVIIKEKLRERSVPQEEINKILFVDANDYYLSSENQNEDLILDNLLDLITPLRKADVQLRTWGNVNVVDSPSLYRYEHETDEFIHKQQLITVCAYDGNKLSASALTRLLKEHEYYMTDTSLVRSPLYQLDAQKATLSIMEQITREKSAENELLRSEQLAFAGQFAAGICHEIRNPLTTIKGFFQLIKESNQKDKYYEVIDNELNRIERITSELLLLSKPHAEKRRIHNLIDLVNDVKLLLDTQAVIKSIAIITEYEVNELFIECEDTKMKQVLINIVKNAIEIMDNGTISIKVNKSINHAYLSIKDEGPGINEEDLKKIGEPFFTTKETGTGLGLTICFNIIKSHGGSVYIDSEVGEGTTFTIKLPLA